MIWSWILVRSPLGVLPIRIAAGFLFAGYNLSNFNMLLAVTPQVHRTRHIALYRTITQSTVAVAPLLGGLIVDRFGFLPVFALSGAGRLISMLLLMRFVREPRSSQA
jgi:MFS family permease